MSLSSLTYRVLILTLNILFPPLAVLILCGVGWDVALNCLFLLLGVLPSHVHGFVISLTYFHRRHKVHARAFRVISSLRLT